MSHPIMHISCTSQPHAYLRKVSTALLSRLLRPADFQCAALRTLARELMINHVSHVVVMMASCCLLVHM